MTGGRLRRAVSSQLPRVSGPLCKPVAATLTLLIEALGAAHRMAESERGSKRARRSPKEEAPAEAEDAGSDTEEDDLAMVMHADATEDDADDDAGAAKAKDNTVNVDFALFDPQEVDFLSLKRFLKVLLPGNDARFAEGASALASAIIAQPAVGTMVKVGDDVDVWAFATVLPWVAPSAAPYRKEMMRFLLSKCPDDEADAPAGELGAGSRRTRLQRALAGGCGRLGLLLSERMLNFPPELAPAIFASLLEDVAWARDQERAAEEGAAAAELDDWLLCLAPCYKDSKTGQGEPPPPARRGPSPLGPPALASALLRPPPQAPPSALHPPSPQSTTSTSRTSSSTPLQPSPSTSTGPSRRRPSSRRPPRPPPPPPRPPPPPPPPTTTMTTPRPAPWSSTSGECSSSRPRPSSRPRRA